LGASKIIKEKEKANLEFVLFLCFDKYGSLKLATIVPSGHSKRSYDLRFNSIEREKERERERDAQQTSTLFYSPTPPRESYISNFLF